MRRDARVIRRLAFALLLVPAILAVHGCGGQPSQGAVAQVGQGRVTQQQFDDLEAAYKAAGRVPDPKTQSKEYRTFQQNLAQYLVMLEVLRQEAPKLGVRVTERDVQAQIDDIKQMFQGDQERFDEALKKQRLTLDQFEESLRERLLIDAVKEAVTKDVTVTEDEVKAYYDSNKHDYTEPEARKTQHILISPFAKAAQGGGTITPTEGDWEAAKAEADKVRSEIQNGADFNSEARKYSDDEATRDAGGELGYIIRGQMVAQFEEAVFSLKKGELSRPVRTEYGYHLIQVTDIRPEAQIPYDQVKEKIRSSLLTERKDQAWGSWLQGMEEQLGVSYRSGFTPPHKAKVTTTSSPLTTDTTAATDAPVATETTAATAK
jgi:parvulin-like peptidyl-prolyl isomerase